MLFSILVVLSMNFSASANDPCDQAYELQSRNTNSTALDLDFASGMNRRNPVQDLINNLSDISNQVERQVMKGCSDELEVITSNLYTTLRLKNGVSIKLSKEVDGEPGDVVASYDGPNGMTDYHLTPNYFGTNCAITLRIKKGNQTSVCEYSPKQNSLANLVEQQPSLESDLPISFGGSQSDRSKGKRPSVGSEVSDR